MVWVLTATVTAMTVHPQHARPNEKKILGIKEKVAFLRSPVAYPEGAQDVDVKETHMSWVFLAGEKVYKLKKPVKYPFLDFSTLEGRETDCRLELDLNRRLAPEIYLGVVPLALTDVGGLALDGGGEPVDWLVKMRRLPADKMLDKAILSRSVTDQALRSLAILLSDFYRNAEIAAITALDYVAHFAREHAENRKLLIGEFDLPQQTTNLVCERMELVLNDEPQLLMTRAQNGRIVDGHGDLRPEHVCFTDPPVIIDCLEFNKGLRLVDPFDELCFLGMECERLGSPHIGPTLIALCGDLLGDNPSDRLLAFYTTYRACLRARLSLAHLFEPDGREPAKWLPLARTYLDIAERASLKLLPQARRQSTRPRGSGG